MKYQGHLVLFRILLSQLLGITRPFKTRGLGRHYVHVSSCRHFTFYWTHFISGTSKSPGLTLYLKLFIHEYIDPLQYEHNCMCVFVLPFQSPRTVTTLKDSVKRVDVGSFDKESPFYQMNLNELKPFARLQVRRLDVFQGYPEYCRNATGMCQVCCVIL